MILRTWSLISSLEISKYKANRCNHIIKQREEIVEDNLLLKEGEKWNKVKQDVMTIWEKEGRSDKYLLSFDFTKMIDLFYFSFCEEFQSDL